MERSSRTIFACDFPLAKFQISFLVVFSDTTVLHFGKQAWYSPCALAKIRIFFTNKSVEFGYYRLIGYFSLIYGYLVAVSSSRSITSYHIEAVI